MLPRPWRMDPHQQCWTSESQCGHHCLAAPLPVGLSPDQQLHVALGNQSSLLMKHNSGFKKTPLGRVCGLIFSLLPHPCSYPGSVFPQPPAQESNPAFSKPILFSSFIWSPLISGTLWPSTWEVVRCKKTLVPWLWN